MTLLFESWYNLAAVVFGAGGSGTVLTLYIMKWIRGRRLDSAKVRQLDVQTDSIAMSEIKHIIEMYKIEIDRKNKKLDEVEAELDEVRRICDHTKVLLDEERNKSREMAVELEELRVKLKRYENRRHP